MRKPIKLFGPIEPRAQLATIRAPTIDNAVSTTASRVTSDVDISFSNLFRQT